MIVPLIFNYLCMIVESLPSIIKCQNLAKSLNVHILYNIILVFNRFFGSLVFPFYQILFFDVLFANDVWERFNSLLTKTFPFLYAEEGFNSKFKFSYIFLRLYAICITICHLLLYDASYRKVHSLYFINKFISNRRFSLYLHLIYIIIE